MKGLEKLTSIRLAEVLTQKNLVPAEVVTDSLYAQDQDGEAFVDSLVGSGHISEWDLARVVVESFQLPFLLASNYDIRDEAKEAIDKELLFDSLVVPVDRFANVVTVVMPVLTPFEKLHRMQKQHDIELFPYVGLASENKNLLSEMYPDFTEWLALADERRAKAAQAAESAQAGRKGGGGKRGGGPGDDWTNIFDSADAEVRSQLDRKK